MARQHAAAVLGDQFAHRDARRREMDAGVRNAPRNGERAQTLAAVPALAGEPFRAALQDVAHPVERLHVVLERGTAEEPDLRHVGRAQTGHAALALDRFDHCRLFAADVRARAPAKLDFRQGAWGISRKRIELARQDRAAARILIAQIDIDRVDAHGPCGNQHAFEEAVRIALEVIAILEGARLAFVDIDRHEPRRRFRTHDLPLAAGGETRAAQAAQSGALKLGQDRIDRPLSGCAGV